MWRAAIVAAFLAAAVPGQSSVAVGGLGLAAAGLGTTFGWLWWRRATPLAAGLALSWAGIALLLAASLSGREMTGNAGMAALLIGATLHLGVVIGVGASRIAGAGAALALVGGMLF